MLQIIIKAQSVHLCIYMLHEFVSKILFRITNSPKHFTCTHHARQHGYGKPIQILNKIIDFSLLYTIINRFRYKWTIINVKTILKAFRVLSILASAPANWNENGLKCRASAKWHNLNIPFAYWTPDTRFVLYTWFRYQFVLRLVCGLVDGYKFKWCKISCRRIHCEM